MSNSLEITRIVEDGYGEYIAYECKNGQKLPLDVKTHSTVYNFLLRMSQTETDLTRYAQLKSAFQKDHPNLDFAFIPRTLYSLRFFHECISEDLKHKSVCPFVRAQKHQDAKLIDKFSFLVHRECWHLSHFANDQVDLLDFFLIETARRLNNLFVESTSEMSIGPLTFDEISSLIEKEIAFFEKHHETFPSQLSSITRIMGDAGPLINFGHDYSSNERMPTMAMGIRANTEDKQVIHNALALECSEKALRCAILYRGGNFEMDKRVAAKTSLSFGADLFTLEGGAAPFHYMRMIDRDAYALVIPAKDIQDSPFFKLGPLDARAQFYQKGEFSHWRARVSETNGSFDFNGQSFPFIDGIVASFTQDYLEKIQHVLQSQAETEELSEKINAYLSKAIQLKTPLGTHIKRGVEIIDAKEIGYERTKEAVRHISKRAFPNDEFDIQPFEQIKPGYFSDEPERFASFETPIEHILLALDQDDQIKGFSIVKHRPRSSDDLDECTEKRISELSWLAVDAEVQNKGIGTTLMFETMAKVRNQGKMHLSLEFNASDEEGQKREKFYRDLELKIPVTIQERYLNLVGRSLFRRFVYDLKKLPVQTLLTPKNYTSIEEMWEQGHHEEVASYLNTLDGALKKVLMYKLCGSAENPDLSSAKEPA